MRRPTLDYARPAARASGGVVLRTAAAACLCVVGAGAGVLFILIGVAVIDRAYGPRSQAFFRASETFQGCLACLIGLMMTGFSIRWFIIAVRPRRTRPIDNDLP